jgi:hypothetical protein
MCPTLRGNGISRREKLDEERDTIPKPVGLGSQLSFVESNRDRTASNVVRGLFGRGPGVFGSTSAVAILSRHTRLGRSY